MKTGKADALPVLVSLLNNISWNFPVFLYGFYSNLLFFIIKITRTQMTAMPAQMRPKPYCMWERGIHFSSTFIP